MAACEPSKTNNLNKKEQFLRKGFTVEKTKACHFTENFHEPELPQKLGIYVDHRADEVLIKPTCPAFSWKSFFLRYTHRHAMDVLHLKFLLLIKTFFKELK